MSDPISGVALPARIVPVPSSVSPEATDVLKRLVGPDGVPHNARYAMPEPEDHAGWMALKAAVDRQYAAAASGLAPAVQSRVETIRIGDAVVYQATPVAVRHPDCAYLDFHGGALVFGGGEACQAQTLTQAEQYGCVCYGVDYRMPPEHPFPAALDDAMAAYRWVLERHAPSNVLVGGRSAGGNLAAALLLCAKDERLPLPVASILLSPEVDLTESGDSFQTHQMLDAVLPGSLRSANLLYAGGADLAHPYLSPLFGDLRGLPPTFLQTGTRDLFLSNTVRMHRALRQAGVAAELHVFEAMPHGGFMGQAPEDRELADEASRFAERHWGASSAL